MGLNLINLLGKRIKSLAFKERDIGTVLDLGNLGNIKEERLEFLVLLWGLEINFLDLEKLERW